jgi:DNA-binding SARP family transcriptional activator
MPDNHQLHLLGECQLCEPAGRPLEFRTRKAKFMLGFLGMWPGGTISREKLASFFWDPAPEEQARASLRQCLKEVREVIGEHADTIIIATRSEVRLDKSCVDVDAWNYWREIDLAKSEVGRAIHIAQTWKGDLFGDQLPVAPVFEAWLQVERLRMRELIISVLTKYLLGTVQVTESETVEIARGLLKIEPCHELAHQVLMRFHAENGDQVAAIRQYELLKKTLDEELDSEPNEATDDLLVAIKRGDIVVGRKKPAAPINEAQNGGGRASKGPPKIVICPPKTKFIDASKDYLAEGVCDLIKVSLSKFRGLIILSWPSSGFDGGKGTDYAALASAINVDYAVETHFDFRQQPAKLVVVLVDCKLGIEIWSDQLPVDETEIHALGGAIAGSVASKLSMQIDRMTLLRFARSVPGNSAAYDIWLRGHQLSRQWAVDADVKAQGLFEMALDLDPGLACAQASLASILNTTSMLNPSYPGEAEDKQRAFELAQAAISIDPFDSRNHIAMAWSWLLRNAQERAQSHFALAVDLNPYDTETLVSAGMGMGFLGQLDVARTWSAEAIRLNPLHPQYFLGYLAAIQFLSGDYKATVETISRCPDVFPDKQAWAAAAFERLGDRARAQAAYRDFLTAVRAVWRGEKQPGPEDIHAWMFRTVPLVWTKGRQDLESALTQVRAQLESP